MWVIVVKMYISELLSAQYSAKCMQTISQHAVVVLNGGPERFQNFGPYKKPDTYLVPPITDLENSLRNWSQTEFFNPRAKFWFLADGNISKFFKILAKFYITDVALVTPLDQVYTYLPYTGTENVSKIDTTPVFLGDCQNASPFFQKVPKLWRNTTVRILTKCITPYTECFDEVGGMEKTLLGLIQANLRFKVHHVIDKTFNFGLVKQNGNYSASFRLLQQREVDMTMGGFRSIGHTQYIDFDFATNHLEDTLVWVVPQAQSLVHWIRIVKSFEWPFWVILFVLTLAMAQIFKRFSHLTKEPVGLFREFPVRVVYRLLLGGHLEQTPRDVKMRIIFIFWVYFCMLFNIVFNSNLINVFFANYKTFQIGSFDDIVESNLDVGLTDDVMDILSKDPDWNLLTEQKGVITCPFGTACLNHTIVDRNLVCCWARRSIVYRMAMSGTKGVHLVDDHLLFFLVLFYFVKGYPMVPQISRIITQLRSTGLVQHISKKVDQAGRQKECDLVSQVLTFERLEGPFYFLVSGWVLGFLVFVGELVQKRGKGKE